jgi:hypothetical protein
MWTHLSALENMIDCSDHRRGYDGLVWMRWIMRLSLWYCVLLTLALRPPTIMLIDLLAC